MQRVIKIYAIILIPIILLSSFFILSQIGIININSNLCTRPDKEFVYVFNQVVGNQSYSKETRDRTEYFVRMTICNLKIDHKYYITSAKLGVLKAEIPDSSSWYQVEFVSVNESYGISELVPFPFLKFYLYDYPLNKPILGIYLEIPTN